MSISIFPVYEQNTSRRMINGFGLFNAIVYTKFRVCFTIAKCENDTRYVVVM